MRGCRECNGDFSTVDNLRGLLLHRLELQHSIAWRDRAQPWHGYLLFGIVRTWAKIREIREYEGNALGLQHRVAIGHLQVQVRASRVAAVPEECERISSVDMVAGSHLDASSLQMSERDETVSCNLQNDVISGNVVQRDRRHNARSVVGKLVHNFRDLPVCYGKNRLAPTPPVFVVSCPVVTRIAVWPDLDPVNSKAFRRVDVTINCKNTAAVIRIVRRTISCNPDASFKGRGQGGGWVLTYAHRKILQRCVAGLGISSWLGRKDHPMP